MPRHEGYVEQPQKGPWGPVRRTVAEPQGGQVGEAVGAGWESAGLGACVAWFKSSRASRARCSTVAAAT